MKRQPYLICYDIAQPKRLARVHRLIRKQAIMIHYSVYYLEQTTRECAALEQAIKALIHKREDDVRIYPLPAALDIEVIGTPQPGRLLPNGKGQAMLLALCRCGK